MSFQEWWNGLRSQLDQSLTQPAVFPYPFGAPHSVGWPYPLPIRNTFVPQVGHVPCVAFLPFLSVTGLGLRISRFVLHLKQYASIDTDTSINRRCG